MQWLRVHPRGHLKARNANCEAGVKAMLAYEPAAHAAASYVDSNPTTAIQGVLPMCR